MSHNLVEFKGVISTDPTHLAWLCNVAFMDPGKETPSSMNQQFLFSGSKHNAHAAGNCATVYSASLDIQIWTV